MNGSSKRRGRHRFPPVASLASVLLAGMLLAGVAWAGGGGPGGEEHHEINWTHGFLGEKEDVEPGLLYRLPGTPPPLLSNIINSAALFFIFFWFGRQPIREALKNRKKRIVQGMEDAARMKADAEGQLAEYEERLRRIDGEIERVRREMRESAEAERQRILAEAKERQARMERDARILVEQEMKAARETLLRETVRSAMRSAEEVLSRELEPEDHQRLASEFLTQLRGGAGRGLGGRA